MLILYVGCVVSYNLLYSCVRDVLYMCFLSFIPLDLFVCFLENLSFEILYLFLPVIL